MKNKLKMKAEWVVVDSKDGKGKCLRCGEVLTLSLPMDLDKFIARLEGFMIMHSKCEEERS